MICWDSSSHPSHRMRAGLCAHRDLLPRRHGRQSESGTRLSQRSGEVLSQAGEERPRRRRRLSQGAQQVREDSPSRARSVSVTTAMHKSRLPPDTKSLNKKCPQGNLSGFLQIGANLGGGLNDVATSAIQADSRLLQGSKDLTDDKKKHPDGAIKKENRRCSRNHRAPTQQAGADACRKPPSSANRTSTASPSRSASSPRRASRRSSRTPRSRRRRPSPTRAGARAGRRSREPTSAAARPFRLASPPPPRSSASSSPTSRRGGRPVGVDPFDRTLVSRPLFAHPPVLERTPSDLRTSDQDSLSPAKEARAPQSIARWHCAATDPHRESKRVSGRRRALGAGAARRHQRPDHRQAAAGDQLGRRPRPVHGSL